MPHPEQSASSSKRPEQLNSEEEERLVQQALEKVAKNVESRLGLDKLVKDSTPEAVISGAATFTPQTHTEVSSATEFIDNQTSRAGRRRGRTLVQADSTKPKGNLEGLITQAKSAPASKSESVKPEVFVRKSAPATKPEPAVPVVPEVKEEKKPVVPPAEVPKTVTAKPKKGGEKEAVVKPEVPAEFRTLKKGETAQYLAEDDTLYVIEKKTDGYYFVQEDGGLDGPHTKDTLSRRAQGEGWKKIEEMPTLTDVVEPTSGTKKTETVIEKNAEQYEELFEGDVWVLRKTDGSERRVTINLIMEYSGKKTVNIRDDDSISGIKDEDVDFEKLRQELGKNGFILEHREDKRRRTATVTENKEELHTVPTLKEHIENLKTEVAEMRFRYAEMDYKKKSWTGRLSTFFRRNLENEKDEDTEYWQTLYKNTLTQLQETELEQIKRSGVTGDALKKEMAGLLQYYKLDENLELFKARTQARLEIKKEDKKWPERVVDGMENIGRWYNKQSKTKKIAFAVVCFGSATGLGFAGGVAGAAAAGVIVGARRGLTGLGTAVTLDTVGEQLGTWLTKRGAGKEINKQLESLTQEEVDSTVNEGVEAYLQKMDAFLKQDIESIEAKFQKQKSHARYRKIGAFGAGIGLSAFLTARGVFTHTIPVSDATEMPVAVHNMSSGVVAEGIEPHTEASVSVASGEPLVPVETAAAEVPVSSSVDMLQQNYSVTAADAKKGLWGILEHRLPEDLPTGEKNRVISSLEHLMQQKLDVMTVAEQKAAGFPTGDVDMIRRGGIIHFDKLLSTEEIQEIMDGKSIAAPVALDQVVDTAVVPDASNISDVVSSVEHADVAQSLEATSAVEHVTPSAKIPDVVSPGEKADILDGLMADTQAAMPTEVPLTSGVEEILSNTQKLEAFSQPHSLAKFFAEHPEKMGSFKHTLGDVRKSVFLTPELRGDSFVRGNFASAQYDYTVSPHLGLVNTARTLDMLSDLRHGAMREFTLRKYDYPLRPSQMESLARLVSVAQDPRMFGVTGLPLRTENIDQYTMRIAALATATGKEEQLEFFLQGRRIIR